MTNEIGRELKVSELKPRTVVWLSKEKRNFMATMWVVEVHESYVLFVAGKIDATFCATRCGENLDQITDDSRTPMYIYEFLGEA